MTAWITSRTVSLRALTSRAIAATVVPLAEAIQRAVREPVNLCGRRAERPA